MVNKKDWTPSAEGVYVNSAVEIRQYLLLRPHLYHTCIVSSIQQLFHCSQVGTEQRDWVKHFVFHCAAVESVVLNSAQAPLSAELQYTPRTAQDSSLTLC